jgi:hypothetical protein
MYVATELQAIATPRSSQLEPIFSSDLDNLPKRSRVGLPDDESYQKDRQYLFMDIFTNYRSESRAHLTSLAFQRDIFICFFGELFPVESDDQSRSFEDGSGGDGPDTDIIDPSSPDASSSGQDNFPLAADSAEGETLSELAVTNHLERSTSCDSASIYETASFQSSSSRPMSNIQDYIQAIQASIWPHIQSEVGSECRDGEISNSNPPALAHGFEISARKMNEFHDLDGSIIPSQAVKEFLDEPQLIVAYLWTERKYIKFYSSPSQRWVFEDVMTSLTGHGCCCFLLNAGVLRGYTVNRLWAVVQEGGLLLVEQTSTDTARTKRRFLSQIDKIKARVS